jgi:hypothetical protein
MLMEIKKLQLSDIANIYPLILIMVYKYVEIAALIIMSYTY